MVVKKEETEGHFPLPIQLKKPIGSLAHKITGRRIPFILNTILYVAIPNYWQTHKISFRHRHAIGAGFTSTSLFVKATSRNCVNIAYHFAPMGGASHEKEYPAKLLEIMVFDINYGKVKGRIFLDILDRRIINRKMTTFRVYDKGLLNPYRKILGTRKLVHPRHMNSFRIFYDIHSITYAYLHW